MKADRRRAIRIRARRASYQDSPATSLHERDPRSLPLAPHNLGRAARPVARYVLAPTCPRAQLLIFVKYSDIFWDCMLVLDAWEIQSEYDGTLMHWRIDGLKRRDCCARGLASQKWRGEWECTANR